MDQNSPYKNQLQSFKKYAEYIRAKKLADQMYIDGLMKQLIEAKAAANGNVLVNEIKELKEQLNTVNENTSFIKKIYCTPKKQSAKQISKEERIQKLQNKMLSRGKKGGT